MKVQLDIFDVIDDVNSNLEPSDIFLFKNRKIKAKSIIYLSNLHWKA